MALLEQTKNDWSSPIPRATSKRKRGSTGPSLVPYVTDATARYCSVNAYWAEDVSRGGVELKCPKRSNPHAPDYWCGYDGAFHPQSGAPALRTWPRSSPSRNGWGLFAVSIIE